jgi:hypothetical protein
VQIISNYILFLSAEFDLGEKYPTYPKIVKWIVILDSHFRECLRAEEARPNNSARLVNLCKDLITTVSTIKSKLNEDAYIAALLHMGIRDTFFTAEERAQFWSRLEGLYRY